MADSLEGRRKKLTQADLTALRGERPLSGGLEQQFQADYQKIVQDKAAMGQRLNPNPDDPLHFYAHRAAWLAGALGIDDSGHGTSRFKRPGHPRMFVGGRNTRTGRKSTPGAVAKNKRVRETALRLEELRRKPNP